MTVERGRHSGFWMRRLAGIAAALLIPVGAALGQLQQPNVQAGDRVDALAITITRFGPYPAQITRAQGPFVLAVVNRSGVLEDTFSLVLRPASGSISTPSSLLDLHSTRSKQRDHQLINPLPGSYQLLFASHPDWTVNITITN